MPSNKELSKFRAMKKSLIAKHARLDKEVDKLNAQIEQLERKRDKCEEEISQIEDACSWED